MLIAVTTLFGGWILLRFYNYVKANVRSNQIKYIYCGTDEIRQSEATTLITEPLSSSNMRQHPDSNYFKDKTLISREVDAIIEQILDYIFRDYFFSWSNKFLPEKGEFQHKLATKFK